MHEYEILLRLRTDRMLAERKWRHRQLVVDATRNKEAQSTGLRFTLRRWLTSLAGLRMEQPQPDAPCCDAPLNAR